MVRNISFSKTTKQFKARTKDVTRRIGWKDLKPGMPLNAVEKAQGLKKGEHVTYLGMIIVKSVRRECLKRLIDEPEYGKREMTREGFPGMNPLDFVAMFPPDVGEVTRIEYLYT